LDFIISNFEIVSDFDIRISNLENKLGASKSPHPVAFEITRYHFSPGIALPLDRNQDLRLLLENRI
jgi:hypothetical protein